MPEIEVKILEIDEAAVIRQLELWGARKKFDGVLDASYFDYPDGNLQRQGRVFRVRIKGKNAEVTYKQNISREGAKIMDENEFTMKADDVPAFRIMLMGLGLEESRRLIKKRTSYQLEGAHFEIDRYPGIPAFLEIEAQDLKTVEKFVDRLGYSMKDTKPWSAYDLFAHYGKADALGRKFEKGK